MQQGVLGEVEFLAPSGKTSIHFLSGWIGQLQLARSIMLPSGQVEVHFVVLCRTIPIRSARKYTIAVGMHQTEG